MDKIFTFKAQLHAELAHYHGLKTQTTKYNFVQERVRSRERINELRRAVARASWTQLAV